MKILKRVIVLFFIFSLTYSNAQNNITNSGVLTTMTDNEPISFATVVALNKTDSTMISGALTDSSGRFSFKTMTRNYIVKISFIGLVDTYVNEIPDLENGQINFGTIQVNTESNVLNAVSVVGEESEMVFKLDKQVFNVGQDLMNGGGSAVDVLNNVPSVDVNLEGAISLRGNANVQILINGKPSVMASGSNNALGSIPASMIERIEIITNPSAKYDASGTTGILNIILKKDKEKGFNGSVTLNTGFPKNHSLGLSLNYRTKKLNVFSQFGIGARQFLSTTNSTNTDKGAVPQTTLKTEAEDEKNENFANVLLGSDFYINKYNMLTISGHYAYELEKQFASLKYNQINSDLDVLSIFQRDENTTATNPKWQYDIEYVKTFKRNKEQSLNFSFVSSYFGKNKLSDFKNEQIKGASITQNQNTTIDFRNVSYTIKGDYNHPFSQTVTLETGAKYDIGSNANDYEVENQINEVWVLDSNFTNNFKYNMNIFGAYSTLAHEGEKFGIKAGLRYEYTDAYPESNSTAAIQRYGNFFPSSHVSYKFSKKASVQFGYSRRIKRPHLFEISPFFSFRDNFNLRTGNPNLKPEFSNVFELRTINNWKKINVSSSIYHSRTVDVMSEVITVVDNVKTSAPRNIGESFNTGIDFNIKYSPVKWLSLSSNANFIYFERKGEFEDVSFDFSNHRWGVRLNTKIKLPFKFDIQIRGRYNSEVEELFVVQKENYYFDLGIRKKINKGKLIVSFNVRDVFNSRTYAVVSQQPLFSFESSSKRGRYFVLGVSYSFGKGEAQEFSGQKMF